MLGVVFVRRLREGKTYADFREAWFPDVGFGVPARVISGSGLADAREIVTVAFLDVDPSDLDGLGERLQVAEATRHERIAEVIESTELRTFFTVDGDDDFTDVPGELAAGARGYPWER